MLDSHKRDRDNRKTDKSKIKKTAITAQLLTTKKETEHMRKQKTKAQINIRDKIYAIIPTPVPHPHPDKNQLLPTYSIPPSFIITIPGTN